MNADIEKALESIDAASEAAQVPAEFVVRDDFIEKLPQILSNVDQIKEWAKERTSADRALILTTDDDFAAARKRCADINKIIETIDKKRIEVKKAYNEPYAVFEKKLKEVTAVLNDAKTNLWGQITRAEDDIKNKKLVEYKNLYEEEATAAKTLPFRSFEQIFDKSWLNKGKRRETVIAEIRTIIKKTAQELDAIDAINSEFSAALYERYKIGVSLTDVIQYDMRLKEEKKAAEARKILQETRKEETRAIIPPEKETPTESAETRPTATEEEPNGQIYFIAFSIETTREKLSALKAFLSENGIKYTRIKHE